MQHLLSGVLLGVFAMTAQAAISGEEIAYRAGDTEMKGYLAYDNAVKGKRPGVLVIPEWWGANDYAKRRARRLAALGYTALAAGMYGAGQGVGAADAELAAVCDNDPKALAAAREKTGARGSGGSRSATRPASPSFTRRSSRSTSPVARSMNGTSRGSIPSGSKRSRSITRSAITRKWNDPPRAERKQIARKEGSPLR